MLLYANDTILLCSDKDPDIVSNKLSNALSNCQYCFTNNKLVMHSGKTESILITSNRKQYLKITMSFAMHVKLYHPQIL